MSRQWANHEKQTLIFQLARSPIEVIDVVAKPIHLNISYDLDTFNRSVTACFRGDNLTNTEARVHSSFLKDLAPRPGRNLSLGVRGYF